MIKPIGILGKPVVKSVIAPPTPESLSHELHQLKALVTKQENRITELEIGYFQHRKALADAAFALQGALTQGPCKWTQEQEQAWNDFLTRKDIEAFKEFTKKTNVLKNTASLPY